MCKNRMIDYNFKRRFLYRANYIMNVFEYDSLLHIYRNNIDNRENIKSQYLALLSFLTDAPNVTTEDFVNQLIDISLIGDILVCYAIDREKSKITIIGSGTIIYEPKIIHGCKKVGHIEDIVVHQYYRCFGIAKNILQKLVELGKNHNCYKIILDCKSELIPFYEKNGFQCQDVNQMSIYF
jgi:glucosamine-phosphate N-acetyltransferase